METCVYSDDAVLHNLITPSEIEPSASLGEREGGLLVISPHVFDLFSWLGEENCCGSTVKTASPDHASGTIGPPRIHHARWGTLLAASGAIISKSLSP